MHIDDLEFEHGVVSSPLPTDDVQTLLKELPEWSIDERDEPALEARFRFNDFIGALAFTNSVAELAESHNHHPQIVLEYGAVTVRWWTHTAGGIATNDVLMAQITNRAYRESR